MEFVINHVLLPPKLPHKDDEPASRIEGEEFLLKLVRKTVASYVEHCDASTQQGWETVLDALNNCLNLQKDPGMCKGTLQHIIANLKSLGAVAIHVQAQNAGLVLFRDGDHVFVDTFEASPKNLDALAANRLVRRFPGARVSFPTKYLGDEDFVEQFSATLERLHNEKVENLQSITIKAGRILTEARNTTDPALVTESLMSVLEALGRAEEFQPLQKNTRDDVNWDDCEVPWRRSPFWLVIRVSIQLLLSHSFSADDGRIQYKNFSALLMATICGVVMEFENKIELDVLSIAAMKAARRLSKLGTNASNYVTQKIEAAVEGSQSKLQNAWVAFQEQSTMAVPRLQPRASNSDTILNLELSRPHLLGAMEQVHSILRSNDSQPLCGPQQLQFDERLLPILGHRIETSNRLYALSDFEQWVVEDLQRWANKKNVTDGDCGKLLTLMKGYKGEAEDMYRNDPRSQSIMLLVIMQIWAILDRACCELYPMLCEYPPEIPEAILEPLLLPHYRQMQLAYEIESHISDRWKCAVKGLPHILADPHPKSFSTRYFDQSARHKDLRYKIESDAQAYRLTKKVEFQQKERLYDRLKYDARLMDHDRYVSPYDGILKHSKNCTKCEKDQQADRISIDVNEWPLPNNEEHLKAVVFEVSCPLGFSVWRDATWVVVHDLGRLKSVEGAPAHQDIFTYDLLRKYKSDHQQLLVIGSQTKSFINTHYKTLRFPTTFDKMCLPSGLHYRLMVRNTRVWANDQIDTPSYDYRCKLQLPSGAYSNLQGSVNNTKIGSNEVLARQAECKEMLTIHEYVAFGSLRCGERIQWLNILRELSSTDLALNSQAVSMLIRHAVLQLGTRQVTKISSHTADNVLREAHAVVRYPQFATRLLMNLENQLQAVGANWKEQHRMATIALLASRAMSLLDDRRQIHCIMVFLQKIRNRTLQWCQQLSLLLETSGSEQYTQRLRIALIRSALICRMTFDGDNSNAELLLHTDDDVTAFVASSIHLHNHSSGKLALSSDLQQQMSIGAKVARIHQDRLAGMIVNGSAGMTNAVKQVYETNISTQTWQRLHGLESVWLSNICKSEAKDASQPILYNTLTGELLLNGAALGYLPAEYTQSCLYKSLFGSRIITVAISSLPLMSYKAMSIIADHEVHFGSVGGTLVIKAVLGSRILRVLQQSYFRGDIPDIMVDNFTHWMDTATGIVDFRPLKEPWKPTYNGISLHFRLNGGSQLFFGDKTLVDQHSYLGMSIGRILQVLESPNRMVIGAKTSGVEIDLPRCGLKFYINGSGQLCSRDFAATVEHDQTIHCLSGLENKLVLSRNQVHTSLQAERLLLIPYGHVTVTKKGPFTNVQIQTDGEEKVRIMYYEIDETLSKLRNAPGAVSTLYRAYLHALTSSPVPDILTGLTGVQESLRILQQQSLFTSSPLETDALLILNKLAELTPKRVFYPRGRQEMQISQWNQNIPQLTQDEAFSEATSKVVEHSVKFASFFEDSEPADSKTTNRGDPELVQRSFLRNRGHRDPRKRVSGKLDRVYCPRDSGQGSNRAARAFYIATLIREWPTRVDVIKDLVQVMRSSKDITGYGKPLDMNNMTLSALLALPIQRQWGALYDLARNINRDDSFSIMFNFSAIAFAQAKTMPILQTLLAIAFSGRFQDLRPESFDYNLGNGEAPQEQKLRLVVNAHCHEPPRLPSGASLSEQAQSGRRYLIDKTNQVDFVIRHLISQFPPTNESEPFPEQKTISLIKIEELIEACEPLIAEWHRNHKFIVHINEVQDILRQMQSTDLSPSYLADHSRRKPVHAAKKFTPALTAPIAPLLIDLMVNRPAPLPITLPKPFVSARSLERVQHNSDHAAKWRIVTDMTESSDNTRKAFGEDLHLSLIAYENAQVPQTPNVISVDETELIQHREDLARIVDAGLKNIACILEPEDGRSRVLNQVGLWPHRSLTYLLACLSGKQIAGIPLAWKHALLALGQGVAMLQRSERLVNLKRRNDVFAFYKEAEDAGHENWQSAEFPDWLLIEIENNLTIRSIQAMVALQMLRPKNNQNAVTQLNMGEGKSSVIIPMLLTAMSDGLRVSRLIVLKSLLRQTEHLLSERLGGLVDRRTYHIPFSRKTKVTHEILERLRTLYVECINGRGVVIALPEHILSYRLHSRERLGQDPRLARKMMALEKELDFQCRDVMDESDQLLDSRFQLVYSMGQQQMMDAQPDRWTITQAILELFAQQAESLSSVAPEKLQIENNGRSFPFISFLDSTVGQTVLDLLVNALEKGGIPEISFNHYSPDIRKTALQFIRQREMPFGFEKLKQEFQGTVTWTRLHLLRGLIAFNVLLFSFQQKRWLVDYGLDLRRCMMAVPYRAKGVPSVASEFGHPDVAIVLTCLCYYHGGLSEKQLKLTFELLVKQPDALSEYARWWHGRDIPQRIRNLSGINLEDDELWKKDIYPNLRFSKGAADSYLNRVVFPHEGKEFPMKLSASAWDLPSASSKNVTTGFSGTNDSKPLLPLSIQQQDLPQLAHTNAMVVDIILRGENRGYVEAKTSNGKRLDVNGLLSLICNLKTRIQVLLDVGAQVLELGNLEVAQAWLKLDKFKSAAVYFDGNDEAMVVTRHDHIESLLTSPFNHKPEDCLFYFDEVHTRGIDIRMAKSARAAVTLGPTLVRDKFVQACGRMRRLGCGQTLVFLSPPEVHEDILAVTQKPRGSILDSADVMAWCFEQACRAIDSLKPLYLMHGLEFLYRSRLQVAFQAKSCPSIDACSYFYSAVQEPESSPLEEMYAIPTASGAFRPCVVDEQARRQPQVKVLLRQWKEAQAKCGNDWNVQEEQEREISHEVEQEKEVEKPPKASALRHEMDGALPYFVVTGNFPGTSSPFRSAFEGTAGTTAHKHLPPLTIKYNRLFLSKDFTRTVKLPQGVPNNEFIRPVKWILSNKPSASDDGILIIISPFEANALLPDIRASKTVSLHMYSAKTASTMQSFSDLKYFTVSSRAYIDPPSLIQAAQLDLFAGTLYFQTYNAYKAMCDFLGILTSANMNTPDILSIGNDGFVDRNSRELLKWAADCPFDESPIAYVGALAGLRRKGMRYIYSHLGQLLEGQILTPAHFRLVYGENE